MAFNINYLSRVSSSANATVKVWMYNGSATGSNEAVATIAASGYFNNAMTNLVSGIGILDVNDVIYIMGNDAAAMYTFTAVTTAVTVSVFAAAGTVGTANITNASVTLAKLAAGITPSHVVKYAGQPTTVGGAAAEAFTVTGVAATDLAFVQIVDNGTNNVTVLQAVCTTNTLTVTFSANPGADAVFNYQILRAAA